MDLDKNHTNFLAPPEIAVPLWTSISQDGNYIALLDKRFQLKRIGLKNKINLVCVFVCAGAHVAMSINDSWEGVKKVSEWRWAIF